MLFLNVKEKQLNINYILTMGNLPLVNSSIIRKNFKSIELLTKHLNDSMQMCCQSIPTFFFDKTQCIKTPFIFQRAKNLHNYNFNQFYVLWNPLHNNLGCGHYLHKCVKGFKEQGSTIAPLELFFIIKTNKNCCISKRIGSKSSKI